MRLVTPRLGLLIAALVAGGCDDTVSGARPIGGEVPTEASLQRFVRRSTLDLTGVPPTNAELAARAAELSAAGNTVEARQAQVSALLASEAFAKLWTEELENRVLGGDTLENRYDFLCQVTRAGDPACQSCITADPCACSCPAVARYFPERADLRTTASRFRASTASSVLERSYAMAYGYQAFLGDADNATTRLFEDFLGRPAELEEREAGRGMFFGFGEASGLLFHRHGASYADLVDIAMDSEVYREAVVSRVFERYLGRLPRSVELAHFVGQLAPEAADVRPVITAVLTSKEYFDP